MEGITILATEIHTTPIWAIAFCILITATLCGICGLAIAIGCSDKDYPILVAGIVGLCILITMTVLAFKEISTKETRYTATIDEAVSFVEFNERYEIIDQNGDLYTLVEKESNEAKGD